MRFGDEDHAGIVYYPRFFDFFHCVFEDFFDAQGLPYQQVLDVDHVGWPAVHIEADFREPLRFGDVMVVDLWAEKIGTKSVVFAHEGRRESNGAAIASARITVACIDMRTFKAQAIPPKYRALFERFTVPPVR